MAATIGSLMVQIGMDVAQLRTDMGKVHKEFASLNTHVEKTAKNTDKMARSFSGLSRSLLRIYADFYVVSAAAAAVGTAIADTMNIIDKYNMSVIKMAAIMTGMMKADGRGLGERYQEAVGYAKQLNIMIEEVDKNTLLTATDLRSITEEMMKQGVVVDTNSRKQVEAFTQLSNALAVVAAGSPNMEMQLRQEVRALLKGELKDSNQLAQMMDAQTGNLKEQIKLHKEQGDIIEWLGQQLTGFAAAQGDINASWEATKTTLQTIGEQILRDSFQMAYKELIAMGKQLSEWAEKHKEEIASIFRAWVVGVKEVNSVLPAVSETLESIGRAIAWLATMPINILGNILYGLTGSEKILRILDALNTMTGSGRANNIPERIPVGPKFGVPKPNLVTGNDDGAAKAAQAANRWVDIQKDLNTQLAKSSQESGEWRDKLIDIDTKYQDIMLKGQGKNAIPIDAKFMAQWKAEMSANVEAAWATEISKINARGEEAERDHQFRMVDMYLDGASQIYNIEKQNQIAIDKLKEEWGEKTHLSILKSERDFQLEELNQAKEAAQRQLQFLSDSNGYNTPESAIKGQDLLQQINKIEAQIAAIKGISAIAIARETARAFGTMSDGMAQAIGQYISAIKTQFEYGQTLVLDFAENTKSTLGSIFSDYMKGELKNFSDYFIDFAKRIADSWANAMSQMVTDWVMMEAKTSMSSSGGGILSSILGAFGLGGGGSMTSGGMQGMSMADFAAKGNVYSGGNIIPFARGGIVSRPTLFPMANGAGLMGEAGPEAVIPLKRASNGELGVSGSGGKVVVNIYNSTNSQADIQQQQTADGGLQIDVIIDEAVGKAINSGRGKAYNAFKNRFGARPIVAGR